MIKVFWKNTELKETAEFIAFMRTTFKYSCLQQLFIHQICLFHEGMMSGVQNVPPREETTELHIHVVALLLRSINPSPGAEVTN